MEPIYPYWSQRNELADKLANSATANSHVEADIGLELSEAHNLFDTR